MEETLKLLGMTVVPPILTALLPSAIDWIQARLEDDLEPGGVTIEW